LLPVRRFLSSKVETTDKANQIENDTQKPPQIEPSTDTSQAQLHTEQPQLNTEQPQLNTEQPQLNTEQAQLITPQSQVNSEQPQKKDSPLRSLLKKNQKLLNTPFNCRNYCRTIVSEMDQTSGHCTRHSPLASLG